MLPSVKELLAFGDHTAAPSAHSRHQSTYSQQLVPDAAPSSAFLQQRQQGTQSAAEDIASGLGLSLHDDTPQLSASSNARQRPGRKVGASDRYSASNGARNYRCGVHSCAALFKRPEHLKRHMLTHTQQRPFLCSARGCGKRFSRRDNYITHKKKHDKSAFASLASSSLAGNSAGNIISNNGSNSNICSSSSSDTSTGSGEHTTQLEYASASSQRAAGELRGPSSTSSSSSTRCSSPAPASALQPVSSIFSLLNEDTAGQPSSPSLPMAPYITTSSNTGRIGARNNGAVDHSGSQPRQADSITNHFSQPRTAPHMQQRQPQHPSAPAPAPSSSTFAQSYSLPPLELLAYASTQAEKQQQHLPPSSSSPSSSPALSSGSAALPSPPQPQPATAASADAQVQSSHRAGTAFAVDSQQQQVQHYQHNGVSAVVITSNGAADPSKPFMCPICSSCFGRLEHVKRHHLVHTGEKTFECPTCGKKFARNDNMLQHLRAHQRKRGSA